MGKRGLQSASSRQRKTRRPQGGAGSMARKVLACAEIGRGSGCVGTRRGRTKLGGVYARVGAQRRLRVIRDLLAQRLDALARLFEAGEPRRGAVCLRFLDETLLGAIQCRGIFAGGWALCIRGTFAGVLALRVKVPAFDGRFRQIIGVVYGVGHVLFQKFVNHLAISP